MAHYVAMFDNPLIVEDIRARDDASPWESDADQVAASSTVLVVRIQNDVVGPAEVNIWDRNENLQGTAAFSGTLHIESGRLWVGDMLRRHGLTLEIQLTMVHVDVILVDPPWASRVDLVLTIPVPDPSVG